jgi:hypothetical protein
MFMSAPQAVFAAQTVPPGMNEHAAACELCRMRGFDPDAPITTVAGLPPMANWHWIIAEQILEQQLKRTLAQRVGGPTILNG